MKYKVTLNNRVYEVEVERGEATLLSEYEAASPAALPASAAGTASPASAAAVTPASTPVPAVSAPAITGAGEVIPSPLPGTVLSINVQQGENVKSGQLLAVVEAMKMENEILAPKDGTITQVIRSAGQKIDTGDGLVVLS